jgi:hypothetical protein
VELACCCLLLADGLGLIAHRANDQCNHWLAKTSGHYSGASEKVEDELFYGTPL